MLSTAKLTNLPKHSAKLDLSPLMEEEPPQVPPKDQRYTTRMDIDRSPSAPASGSKRKREVRDDTIYDIHHGQLEIVDPDQHTPKRSRPTSRHTNASADEERSPTQPRNVRRKKGSRNLSNLNLRHAAEKQAAKQAQLRDSKFQEGSLTDKPSEQPPSIFTQLPRTKSGNLMLVDELMTDYHNGMPTPRDSTEEAIHRERASTIRDTYVETDQKNEAGGFFQFGRQLAASFHPISLFQRMWGETKEELPQQKAEEAERNRQKTEAAAKYAEMKQAGQLRLEPVGSLAKRYRSSADGLETPRDSGVDVDGLNYHTRAFSTASGLMPPIDDTTSRSGSEVPDTATKQSKTLKSRLHFKKPSLTNIKSDLKRVRSDLSLASAIHHRESSSSISPVKTDFDSSTLRKSHSKYELKKQNKLSKRVSDLESKLDLARRELDEALVDASPMPKLSVKHERFLTAGTIKRPKFIPGKLPSLPSERILMAERMMEMRGDDQGSSEARPRNAINLSEFAEDEEMKEETPKASRAHQYPTRASTLFNLDNDNIEKLPTNNNDKNNDITPDEVESSNLNQEASEEAENRDPDSIMSLTSDGTPDTIKQADYSSLDAKLKALDANVKTARKAKAPKSKKRKSGVDDDEKLFKPGKESDDDAEWEAAQTPKKKRKSTEGSSPQNRRTTDAKQSSPSAQKGRGGSPQTTSLSSSPTTKKDQTQEVVQDPVEGNTEVEAEGCADEFSADEVSSADDEQFRTSQDSQGRPLDIVYEEEEETVMIPTNDEPSKPTTKATPARYARSTFRSRSTSPHKRSGSVEPGVEEQIITRAAEVAKQHPARMRGRRASPPPVGGFTKTTIISETVTVMPGEDGVPQLPKGPTGSFESLGELKAEMSEVDVLSSEKEGRGRVASFEWPEDVF